MVLATQRRLSWIILALPIVLFYSVLSRTLTGLPFYDDYHTYLGFLLTWTHAHSINALRTLFFYQHNEYRLVLSNAVYALQHALIGHASLKILSILGDLLVLPLFGVLYLIWRQFLVGPRYQLLAFLPVPWILFQLQYASTLNCVMAPLQNVAVLVFILLSFYMAALPGQLAFAGCVTSLLLAIASSGSGLFVGPVLCLLFLQRRQWKRLGITVLVATAASVLYFSHGYVHSEGGPLLSHVSLRYAATFLGSIAAKDKPFPAIFFSSVLFTIFLLAWKERIDRVNPAVFYASLFFFLQAVAVSGARSGRGLVSALGSRYRISSAVLVILLYFYLAYRLRDVQWSKPVRLIGPAALALLLLGFNLASDRAGNRLLTTRRAKVQAGIVRWERHEPKPPPGPADPNDFTARNDDVGAYDPFEPFLSESIAQGLYTLPPPGKDR